MDRRQFIQASAVAAGASMLPSRIISKAKSGNKRIRLGYIGTGTQGIRVLFDFLRNDDILVAAVCDANRDSQNYIEWYKDELREKIRLFLGNNTWGENNTGCRAGRMVGKEIIDTYYTTINPVADYQPCPDYENFLEMMEKEDLDAVCIMTPEHLHATIAIAAMKKGLNVITHKPLGNFLSEARLAANVAEQTGVATHLFCASASHTTPLLCEWIWNGAIGQVLEVHNWSTRPIWPQGMTSLPQEKPPVPDGLNWDLWLGPAQDRPYNPAFTNALFRGWYEFGSGALGDMGHYSFFQIWKILKLGAPATVEASRSEYHKIVDTYWSHQVNEISYPRASMVKWHFPEREDMSPVDLFWYDGCLRPPVPEELDKDGREMPEEGMLFVGDKGKILASFMGGSPRIIPESQMKAVQRPPKTLPRPEPEIDQFVRACRGGKSDADFSTIRTINEAICLGNVALRVGGKLKWDDANMRITNHEEANKYMFREYRKGWELDVDKLKG